MSPPQTLPLALDALHAGHYEKAEAQLRVLAAANPHSAEILDNLGIAFQLQGKTEDAARWFEKALRIKRLPDAVAMLALDYCRDHDFRRAGPLLDESRAYLSDPNIAATVGPCFLEADQPDIAAQVFETLVRLRASPEDENNANLVRAYLDLSRKLLASLASLPAGAPYVAAVQSARSNESFDASDTIAMAYREAPYLSQPTSIEEGLRFLPEHHSDPALLYLLGTMCATRAADAFDRLQDRWPSSIATKRLIAELKDAQGDRDSAIETYEQIVAEHPDAPPSVHFALGLLYSERRRWADALDQYRSVASEASASLYLRQRISEALVHLGKNQEVIQLLSKVVATSEAPFWALRDFGEAAQGIDHEHEAISALERAEKLNPADTTVHYNLLHAYHKLHLSGAERAELLIVKRLSAPPPSNVGAGVAFHVKQARQFESSHDTKDAEIEWRAALALDPERSEVLDGLSSDLNREAHYAASIELLDSRELLAQRTPAQALNLGIAYERTGRPEQAAAVLQDAFNTSPNSVEVANELASVLLELGRFAEAADTLRLIAKQREANLRIQVLYIRALLRVAPTDSELAARARRLLMQHPENWEVQYLNGTLDAKQGDLPNARAHLEMALQGNPQSAEVHSALASVCAQLKRISEAKDHPRSASGSRQN